MSTRARLVVGSIYNNFAIHLPAYFGLDFEKNGKIGIFGLQGPVSAQRRRLAPPAVGTLKTLSRAHFFPKRRLNVLDL